MVSAGATIGLLNYSRATGPEAAIHSAGPGCAESHRGFAVDPRWTFIHDGREIADRLTLDGFGFRFLRRDTAVTDFDDSAQIREIYSAEIEALIREQTNAAQVVVFDTTLRSSRPPCKSPFQPPVFRVHADFTAKAAVQTVRDVLPNDCDALLSRRFAIFQVWRPIGHPVESFPFAIADARSVSGAELITIRRVYPDWVGETCFVGYRPYHRWYWFPRMTPQEVVLFKVYDSATDGIARWAVHSAFAEKTPVADARERQSIEIRALAFY
jgi:hypothetical protein